MDLREQLQATLTNAYTIERELGGGGMARVFVADELRLRRKVVVKVLSPDLAQGLSAERFEREIQVAASLQQANIVPVLSTGETGGLPFYTMPYVDGESLRSRLRDGGPLSIGQAVSVLRDVARALAYAHDRGIVHRDIKPDNVLLSGATAVVTDFGIAKAIAASRTDSDGGATLTQLGTSIGTPAYISPEQAAGDPEIDHRADIYSFGCMAYELLAGRPPFVNRTPQRLMAAHMSEKPQPVIELRPDAPPSLTALVMRCLEKDAVSRPQSAAEVLAALEGAPTSDPGATAMPSILLGGRGMLKKALAVYAAAFVVVAVVAKAAIVGIGLPDWVFPGALVVMALGLPVILFTGYTQYVARRAAAATPTFTPGGTPSSAAQGTMATIAIKAMPLMSWRRTALGGAWAVGAFVVVIGVFMVLRAFGIGPAGSLLARGAITKNERVIVGDFASRTSDTTLGPVVTEAFRTSLGQSQSITIMQSATVREVLRRMQRPPGSRVDLALAREIGTREGVKAVVDGQILGVGGTYTISASLIATQTGEPLASFTENADDDKGILPAIDRLSKRMRARIGESLRTVQATSTLDQVTTPSLEALKKYVQGSVALQSTGEFAKGVRLLEEAIALDTGFAMAYRKLAIELFNAGGQNARVMQLLQKAFDHQDRLSESERYVMLGTYYATGPRQDLAKSNASYEAAIDLNPRDIAALNNVGNNYRAQRDFAKAEAVYKRAIAEGTPAAVFYNNLISSQVSLGKLAAADTTISVYANAVPNSPNLASYTAGLLILHGNYDSATAVLQRSAVSPASSAVMRANALLSLANIAEAHGHVAEALRRSTESRQAALSRGVAAAVLQVSLDSIYNGAWYRGDRDAAAKLDAALQAHPLDSLAVADRPYAHIVMLYSMAGRADRARAIATNWDKSRAGVTQLADTVVRETMNGDIAFAERRFDDAVRAYRFADAGPCTLCRLPLLGRAYDLAGNADSAIAVFTRYVETPYLSRAATDAQYLAGTHKRLGELWDAKGNRQKAAEHYNKFLELWKNADPELQPQVAAVRKSLARLGDPETRR
jgi:tetratricopeptide (TPR) repeat protein/tRNA A-37 threonylcarbamoyl transferase component Bud32/TolB-like protein